MRKLTMFFNRATLTAVNGRTGDQTTTYTYGTTLSDSDIASNSLLRYVNYPDSVSGSDRVSLTYNRLGQVVTRTDQRGTIRTFNYDKLGRPTDDCVTTVGTAGTDTVVLRISSTYEVRGMIATLTNYDDPTPGSGTALHQVELEYNAFAQLESEYQEHDGTVDGATPAVGYAYASGASGSNQIRPGSLTYPDSRQIDYDYGTANAIDDRLSRPTALKDGTLTLAGYTYLGAGTPVRIDYSQPNVRLDLWGGTTQVFDGFDRFGRIIDQRWRAIGGSDLDRYQYGYDRDSNRVWKQNTVASGNNLDEGYAYDHLNRLGQMQRGTLGGGTITGTPARELDYTLDPTGNWRNYLTKTTGTTDLDQNRTSGTVNQITAIDAGTGATWVTPAYDAAGNTTTLPQPDAPTSSYTAVYDAWNRLVKVSAGGTTVAEYQYDGRGRRIVKKTYTGGTLTETRHFYWSNAWQDLEERVGTATTADVQQVWGIRYVDELVCRDDATPQRLYAAQDANFNVTALLDAATGGAVQQRFIYEPYGTSTVLAANWSATTDAYAWNWRHQGLCQDVETGIIYNRMRHQHPALGLFLARDPIGYAGGINLYQYMRGRTIIFIDPSGTTMTIERVNTPQKKAFVTEVLAALSAICPSVSLKAEAIPTYKPNETPGAPGVTPEYIYRVVARKSDKFNDKEGFCKSTKEHAAGCRLVHDLLTSNSLLSINLYNLENGNEGDQIVVGPSGNVISHSGDTIHWNPYFSGRGKSAAGVPFDASANADPKFDSENRIAVLAHELSHAWDAFFGMKIPDNLNVPTGFQKAQWFTEMLAVRVQNQVFQELTGIAGARKDYSGNPVTDWDKPKLDPCDCNKAFDELPWGAKQ